MTARFLIENNGPDEANLKMMLREVLQFATTNNSCKVTLIVPSKGDFQYSFMGQFLGEIASKMLCKGAAVELQQGLTMELTIPKQVSSHGPYDIVIALYLSQRDFNALDSIRAAKAIVYLPWLEEEGRSWLSIWSPTIWGPSTWAEPVVSIPAVVERELQRLTNSINMSTGLGHPSDKSNAKRTISELVKNGHLVVGEDIRRWAIKNGWQPKYAEDLKKMIGRIVK
jgi:hypothetical protein